MPPAAGVMLLHTSKNLKSMHIDIKPILFQHINYPLVVFKISKRKAFLHNYMNIISTYIIYNTKMLVCLFVCLLLFFSAISKPIGKPFGMKLVFDPEKKLKQ